MCAYLPEGSYQSYPGLLVCIPNRKYTCSYWPLLLFIAWCSGVMQTQISEEESLQKLKLPKQEKNQHVIKQLCRVIRWWRRQKLLEQMKTLATRNLHLFRLSPLCVSNESLNFLPEGMRSHIGCICLAFLYCVSWNCLPKRRHLLTFSAVFLAVQNSSIGDLVTHWLSHWQFWQFWQFQQF